MCDCHACTCTGCVRCDPDYRAQPSAVFNPTSPDPWAASQPESVSAP